MRRVLPIAGLSFTLLLSACQAVNTTSGGAVGVERKQYMFSMLSAQQVDQMYAQSYQKTVTEAKSAGKLANDTANGRRVQAIAKRLIAQTTTFRPDAANWDWQVNLVDHDDLNANCGPGGKIFVYTGLIEKLNLTDDELAAVMGHEIAHALREHSREQMSRAYAIEMGENIGGALLGIGQTGMQLADQVSQVSLTLPFSRSNENEADLIGLELAARAGYNPNAATTLWQKMSKVSGNSQTPEMLSTHPSDAKRMAALEAAIPKVMPLYEASRKSS
ncbi:peptidase M48-like protein [Pseudomonas duriflava]|uniref:Peptidase M48-like protein n=1 Tax=Pseudomonas duriflava TaxID=459528 RepID=A0A562QDW7_9PSED|nr:M48 family metallopeptidase [Pseudomonas duriflava]TWI54893.1 peptidase M48-like protein [Pseudomonas duriflava]